MENHLHTIKGFFSTHYLYREVAFAHLKQTLFLPFGVASHSCLGNLQKWYLPQPYLVSNIKAKPAALYIRNSHRLRPYDNTFYVRFLRKQANFENTTTTLYGSIGKTLQKELPVNHRHWRLKSFSWRTTAVHCRSNIGKVQYHTTYPGLIHHPNVCTLLSPPVKPFNNYESNGETQWTGA